LVVIFYGIVLRLAPCFKLCALIVSLAPCALIVSLFFYLLYRVALRLAPSSLFRVVMFRQRKRKPGP